MQSTGLIIDVSPNYFKSKVCCSHALTKIKLISGQVGDAKLKVSGVVRFSYSLFLKIVFMIKIHIA